MRICVFAALLAAACSQAQPRPVTEATRESAGQSTTDAGSQAANEPGGSSLGSEDAGVRQQAENAADAGQQAAADAGQDVAGGIKQGASEAARNVGAGVKEAAQGVAQGASEAGRYAADAGAKAVGAIGGAASDVAEAVQKLPPAPPIPDTPPFLPAVEESRDNPTTPDKVWLGYQLFFDKRLSRDGSMSCESCHHPEQAWTSGNATDPKVGGTNKRNAPSMENVAYYQSFYWDGRAPTMEAVSAAAWKGQLGADPDAIAAKLSGVAAYRAQFQRAFKEDATGKNVPMALAAFLRALKTGNSRWDKFEQGEGDAVSMEARRGYRVFQNARCTLCHVPPLYTDSQFHNAGVGFDKPETDRDHGRMDATKDAKDDGKFKTPGLRDVAKTGPYFHDGSVKTLSEAIDFMVKGGNKNPNRDEKLKPSRLNAKDRKALQAFLESLTGTATFTKSPELP